MKEVPGGTAKLWRRGFEPQSNRDVLHAKRIDRIRHDFELGHIVEEGLFSAACGEANELSGTVGRGPSAVGMGHELGEHARCREPAR